MITLLILLGQHISVKWVSSQCNLGSGLLTRSELRVDLRRTGHRREHLQCHLREGLRFKHGELCHSRFIGVVSAFVGPKADVLLGRSDGSAHLKRCTRLVWRSLDHF